MARTYSIMKELGSPAPPFDLIEVHPENGTRRSLEDFRSAEALVVVFTCNHCPYAQHVEDTLIAVAREYEARGVASVAISSNDPEAYPDDSPEAMAERAQAKDYPFPYLYDGTQEVAHAYSAVCTPDVFVYDHEQKLVYRGRIDESRPGVGTSTGADLRRALDQLLQDGQVTMDQMPSMGCNIKWKPGSDPAAPGGAAL